MFEIRFFKECIFKKFLFFIVWNKDKWKRNIGQLVFFFMVLYKGKCGSSLLFCSNHLSLSLCCKTNVTCLPFLPTCTSRYYACRVLLNNPQTSCTEYVVGMLSTYCRCTIICKIVSVRIRVLAREYICRQHSHAIHLPDCSQASA